MAEASVHKDFHGALSYGLQFIEERHGGEAFEAFLRGLADTVYRPLVDDLRARGLDALEDHWRRIFDLEAGDYAVERGEGRLVLTVSRCPAIHHMREHGYAVAPHFCQSTRLVNEAVCAAAGYACSTDYDQQTGRCVQRFWKAEL